MRKDIFISYKNDGEGNNFAARLKNDLEKVGYSVFFNSHEQKPGPFPERLKTAIQSCNDFVLILSEGCLKQLISNREVDWVREELICASTMKKNILPILVGNVEMPEKSDFPKMIQFLADLEAIVFPEQYLESPFQKLLEFFNSIPNGNDYAYVANSNENYNLQKDFNETLCKAENGDIQAMFEIACMYYYGFTSKESVHGRINYSEAAKWLKKMIDLEKTVSIQDIDLLTDMATAKAMLSDLYYCGAMPREEQSFKKSMQLLRSIEDNNNELIDISYIVEKIGTMLAGGVGNSFDCKEIFDFFDKHKNHCSNNAKNNMAKVYMRYGLFDKAIEVLESVEEPYPDMEYKLGVMYLQGLHCNPPHPDVYRAEHYLLSSANNGNLDALHALGLMNFRGQYGYRKNFVKARKFFREGAKKGHRGAQYDYAWMCKNGLGDVCDLSEAIKYFEEAALKGHALSMCELASLYQESECRNYQKALEWAKKSADLGNPKGEFIMGNLLLFGRGCDADIDNAAIYYQKSLEHGFYQAKFMLDKILNVCHSE